MHACIYSYTDDNQSTFQNRDVGLIGIFYPWVSSKPRMPLPVKLGRYDIKQLKQHPSRRVSFQKPSLNPGELL